MKFPFPFVPLGVTPFLAACAAIAEQPSAEPTRTLEPFARIAPEAIDESSGIVRSRTYPDVYWTLNDSGGEATLYPITLDGEGVRTAWALENDAPYSGMAVVDAQNIDWEDIAIDDAGHLIVGAFGNNQNHRRDLALYIVPEVHPNFAWKTRSLRRIDFHYPDQDAFPPEGRNFDCEALFHANGKYYLLTKHRADTRTKLYRMDAADPDISNPLTLLSSFDIGGMVTAADVSADGTRLLVLTYSAIWLFEVESGDDYFAGDISMLPIKALQCEAIAWIDDESFVITNEQRDIFRLGVDELTPVN